MATLAEVLEDKGLDPQAIVESEVSGIDYEEDAGPSMVLEEGEGAAEIRIRIPHAE